METCDVLITGGGPAGSTCAWALRQAGLDVVIVDRAMFARDIVFNAGTHTETIAMRWVDFARSVKPIVGKFAEPAIAHVEAIGLSFRE
jgi:flavin-dependent dehydrogenase